MWQGGGVHWQDAAHALQEGGWVWLAFPAFPSVPEDLYHKCMWFELEFCFFCDISMHVLVGLLQQKTLHIDWQAIRHCFVTFVSVCGVGKAQGTWV